MLLHHGEFSIKVLRDIVGNLNTHIVYVTLLPAVTLVSPVFLDSTSN